MNWSKPLYCVKRFGFEVTMYIYQNSVPEQESTTKSFKKLSASLTLITALLACSLSAQAHGNDYDRGNNWPSYGGDLGSSGQARQDGSRTKIDKNTVNLVDGMRVKWIYETTPTTFIGQDTDQDFDQDPVKAAGAILSPPAVSSDGYLYFADTLGYVHAINKNFAGSDPNNLTDLNNDGDPKTWKTFAPTDYSQPGKFFLFSRNTPALDEQTNTLYYGNQSNMNLSSPIMCQATRQPSISYDPSFEAIRAQCAQTSMNTPLGEKYAIGGGVPTDGAILIAVNRLNGQLRWSTKLEKHPWSIITQSPVIFNGVVYVGISSREELTTGFTKEPPSLHGSMVAVNADNGKILWKTYTSPLDTKPTNDVVDISRINYTLKDKNFHGSYSGGSIWGTSPSIDPKYRRNAPNGMVLVGVGENHTVPNEIAQCRIKQVAGQTIPSYCFDEKIYKDNLANSVVAFDLKNGRVIWASKFADDKPFKVDKKNKILEGYFDAWNTTCEDPGNNGINDPIFPRLYTHCSAPGDAEGMDGDFGQAPMLLTVNHRGPKEIVVIGQKTGSLRALDRETGAIVKWWGDEGRVKLGPAGKLGGIAWGSATDGQTIFTSTTNSRNLGQVFADAGEPLGITRDDLAYQRIINPPVDIATDDTIVNEAEGMREFYDNGRTIERSRLTPPLPAMPTQPLIMRDNQGNLQTIGGVWHAVDAATGRIKWQRPDTTGYLTHPSMTVADGLLFVGSKNPFSPMRILNADTGVEVWRSSVASGLNVGNIGSRPAVVDGVAYWPVGYIALKGVLSREQNKLIALAPEKILAPKRYAVASKRICMVDPSRPWDQGGAAFLASLNPALQPIANILNTGKRLIVVDLHYPVDKTVAINRLLNGTAHKLRTIEDVGGDDAGADTLRRTFVETQAILTYLGAEYDVKNSRSQLGSGTETELKMNLPDAVLATKPSVIWPFPDGHEKILGPHGLFKITIPMDLSNSLRANSGSAELPLANISGQFPLVILSHGTLSPVNQQQGVGEVLAGQGYIVAAVGHTGDNVNSYVGLNCPNEFITAQPPAPGLDLVGAAANPIGTNAPPLGLGLPSSSTRYYDSIHKEYGNFYQGPKADALHILDRILDVRLAINQVRDLPLFKVGSVSKVDQTKAGLIGYSRGGIMAPLAAELLPEITATISFNGGTPTRMYNTVLGPGVVYYQPLFTALNGGMPVSSFTKPLLLTINDEDTVLRDLLFGNVNSNFDGLQNAGIPVNRYAPATQTDPNPIAADNCLLSTGPTILARYRNADHFDYTYVPAAEGGNDPDLDRPRAFSSGRYAGHFLYQRYAIRDNLVISFMDMFLKGNTSSSNTGKLLNDNFLDLTISHKNIPGVSGGGCP
ncbi:MAG: PQQ-binding-like beta-propeller repeat protein [Gammaproteobacteria bacterium]|nr:PQQ-binding-like beta-propeller repeat protein [Gammaproteobacteria bacterium]